jgi:hypothetical protein
MVGDGREVWRRWGSNVCVGSDIYSATAGGENWRWIGLGRSVCSAEVVVVVLPWS